jgi:hypothetical protein
VNRTKVCVVQKGTMAAQAKTAQVQGAIMRRLLATGRRCFFEGRSLRLLRSIGKASSAEVSNREENSE